MTENVTNPANEALTTLTKAPRRLNVKRIAIASGVVVLAAVVVRSFVQQDETDPNTENPEQ